MNAVLDHVALDDAPHVAEPLRSFAVTAQPCFNTGIFYAHADVVNGGCTVFHSGHSGSAICGASSKAT